MGNFTFTNTYQTLSSNNFFKKTSNLHMIHGHLCVAHDWAMSELKLNKNELKVN